MQGAGVFSNSSEYSRLDFRRSLGSGLCSSPRRGGWTRKWPISVCDVNSKLNVCIATGLELRLISRKAAGNRTYKHRCFSKASEHIGS